MPLRRSISQLKLAWSREQIDDTVAQLRSMVLDFDILSSQATRCMLIVNPNSGIQAGHRSLKRRGSFQGKEMELMETFRQIRQAAQSFHSALTGHWLCHAHDSHELSICCVQCSNGRSLSFETVLAGYENGEAKSLVCEEVETGDHSGNMATSPTSSSLKGSRNTEALEICSTSVSQEDPDFRQVDQMIELGVLEPTRTIATHPTKIQDLCLHFQQQCETMPSVKPLISQWSELTMQRSFVLGPARRGLGRARSLAELVKSGKPLPLLSRIERTSIAASLAKSVLQFYSTPWLPQLWNSENIVFFQKPPSVTDIFDPLYLSIRLHNDIAKSQGIKYEDLLPSLTVENDFIRNELLFRLGVVLLETGLAWPWDSLRHEMVENKKVQKGTSLCNIADKLAQTDLLSHMGPDYSTAVRMCLGCDFGLGINDFNSEQLQVAFHREVVQRLQDLRRSLAEM